MLLLVRAWPIRLCSRVLFAASRRLRLFVPPKRLNLLPDAEPRAIPVRSLAGAFTTAASEALEDRGLRPSDLEELLRPIVVWPKFNDKTY